MNALSIKYILSVRKYQSLFNYTLSVKVFIKIMKYLLNVRKRLIIYSLLKSLSDQIADSIYIKEFNKSSSQLAKSCLFLSQCCSQSSQFCSLSASKFKSQSQLKFFSQSS